MSLRSVADLFSRAFETLIPSHAPEFLIGKPDTIKSYLGFEGGIESDHECVMMNDGALGRMWEIGLIPHETLSEFELTTKISKLCEVFSNARHKHASFQIIFDASPSSDFEVPNWTTCPKTIAQKIQSKRIRAIQDLAHKSDAPMRTIKRTAYICLRLEDDSKIGLANQYPSAVSDSVTTTENVTKKSFKKQLRELENLSQSIEQAFSRNQIEYKRSGLKEIRDLTQDSLHGLKFQKTSNFTRKPLMSDVPLRDQVLYDFVELRPNAVGAGEDTWEVLSWAEKSQNAYPGMMARLLQISVPMRVVLNLRRAEEKNSLEQKLYFLKNSTDSQSERQQSEIKNTLDRIEYGEELYATSMHILIRNENIPIFEVDEHGQAKKVVELLHSLTNIPFLHERYSAPAIFFSCLPFHYSKTLASFNAREKLVLSTTLANYLPVFCGFKGTNPRYKTQIVQNRAGEAVYLSPRASETSSHVALLAGSGAGKSFWHAGYLLGELASNPTSLHFVIDRLTSYEILARTVGEEIGYTIAKPPESYPNVFRGALDADGDRLRTIVNVLTTAISLVSQDESVDAVKANLLSLAIQKTFEDIELDSNTRFDSLEASFAVGSQTKVPIPRLTDVIDNLLPVCEREGFEKENVAWIRERLSPFYGNGPYANLFDRIEFNDREDATPGFSLYDINGVSGDKILSTLTVLIIISEIVRQVKRPENKGKLGTITIEEAGVIGSSSQELISFIELLWKIFRKLGYTCIGLTNDSRDYKFKPGPKTIWRMSPNKVVMRMLSQDIEEALSSTEGEPALFSNEMIGKIISSLKKKDGVYSQALWFGDETQGTVTYMPLTGYEYWVAASKPEEVSIVRTLTEQFASLNQPYFKAVSLLAHHFPNGVRDENKQLRALTDYEMAHLQKEGNNL